MDFISPIEDAIITRLEEMTAKRVLVQSFPENPDTWEPTHPVGALLVRYAEADYSTVQDIGQVVQERVMNWEITLAFWGLRGKQGGIYSCLELVRSALTGFTPPGCRRKLTPIAEGYVNSALMKSKNRRLWQYQITLQTATMNIELQEEEPVILVKQITAISESTNETIVVSSEVP